MICLFSMCKSLLLSQFLRLLKSPDEKSIAHVGYWIGDTLGDLLPGIDNGPHAESIPEYFANLEFLLVEGRIDNFISAGSWHRLTNKLIYLEHSKTFPIPKIERDADVSYANIWRLINLPIFSSPVRDISYLIVHNKLPVRERLFRINLVNNPYCLTCRGSMVCDVEHFFSSCQRVNEVWRWLKGIIVQLLGADITDRKLLNFSLPGSHNEAEVAWLLGNYFAMVWFNMCSDAGDKLKMEEFFGFLTFKYKEDQLGSRFPLKPIPGLN